MITRLPTALFSPPDVPGSVPASPAAPDQTPAPAAPAAAPSGTPAPDNADNTPAAVITDPNASVMPSGLDPKYYDAQHGVKTDDLIKDFNELAAFKTKADEKAASVPAKPDDYKLELPKAFTEQLPKEMKITYDVNDPVKGPIIKAVRDLAKEVGLDQAGFSKALELEARLEIAKRAETARQVKAERGKLGDRGEVRIKAIEDVLNANLDEVEYQALEKITQSSAGVSGLEKLIKLMTTNGIPGDKQPGAEGGEQQNETPKAPLVDRLFPNRKVG